jgi:hypothetical protein
MSIRPDVSYSRRRSIPPGHARGESVKTASVQLCSRGWVHVATQVRRAPRWSRRGVGATAVAREITAKRIDDLDVPSARLCSFGKDFHTFCVQRFDRIGAPRRFYASAMAMLRKERCGYWPPNKYLLIDVMIVKDHYSVHGIH